MWPWVGCGCCLPVIKTAQNGTFMRTLSWTAYQMSPNALLIAFLSWRSFCHSTAKLEVIKENEEASEKCVSAFEIAKRFQSHCDKNTHVLFVYSTAVSTLADVKGDWLSSFQLQKKSFWFRAHSIYSQDAARRWTSLSYHENKKEIKSVNVFKQNNI